MAEIRVKKKDTPVWPWILGLLALALIIGWWVAQPDQEGYEGVAVAPVAGEVERDPVVADDVDAVAVVPAGADQEGAIPQPVQAYSEFVREGGQAEMNLDHDYTARGIRLATAGYASIIDKHGLEAGVRSDLERIGQHADRIQRDPQSLQHANTVKEAFMGLTEVADTLAQRLNLQDGQMARQGAGFEGDDAQQGIQGDQMARQGADLENDERAIRGRDLQGDPMANQGTIAGGDMIAQMRQTAQSLETDVPLLEQGETVKSFFRQNEQVLQRMATATPVTDAAVQAEE